MDDRTASAIEMRHLRLIATIAERGTMTAAADGLGLTQPALSHQLRELESRLRSPLFTRTARRMVLTPAGEQLAVIARAVLPQIDSFERQVLDGELDAPHGAIRIATQCYTAYHWLPGVLRSFSDRWPSVELTVAAECTATTIPSLREGALDLAIVFTRIDDKRVRYEPLFDDEMVLVVPPDHPLAQREYAPLAAITDEHLITYTTSSRRSTLFEDILGPAGVHPKRVTRLQLTEAIIELVAAGLGVTIMAKWAVQPAVQSRAVTALRLGRRGYTRTWFAATRSGDVTPAFQFDLIELLKRHLASGPGTMRAVNRPYSEMRM